MSPPLLFSYLGRSFTGVRLALYLVSLVAVYPIWWLLLTYGARVGWPTQIAQLSIDLPAAIMVALGALLKKSSQQS